MKYKMLTGQTVDLSALPKADLEFLVALSRRAIADEDYGTLALAVAGPKAYPKRGGRWVTREVMESLVYRVAEDIVDRVGIRQGALGPDEGAQASAVDQILGVTEAARILGITRAGVIKAATSGRLQGRKIGKAWALLRGSVERYRVARARVLAGRAGGLAAKHA